MSLPEHVKIVEVSPRDGLQNEKQNIPTDVKVTLINRLSDAGLTVIEAGSFVSPKWIPQLADSADVFKRISKKEHVHYPVLVPNEKGLRLAIECGVKDISIFTTPSETFSQKNTNCTVKQSMENLAQVMKIAKDHQINVRGYISCVLGCPYEGKVDSQAVAEMASEIMTMGCEEISLGDTIGVGTPEKTRNLIQQVSSQVDIKKLAVHFHDTYGQALVNIYAALQEGIATVDASVAGLGGCPYANGASGNVATEDVIYMLDGLNIHTGVDLSQLVDVGRYIAKQLGREPNSKVNLAM